jgi:hypothetical protein
MTMAMAMAGKQKKQILSRTKAQGRLLLFWVVCVCLMGVLYGHMGTITIQPQPQTANMAAYWPACCLISRMITHHVYVDIIYLYHIFLLILYKPIIAMHRNYANCTFTTANSQQKRHVVYSTLPVADC